MEAAPRGRRRVGVIDIGSNSVRFVLYHIFGSAFFPTYNEKVLAGLGRDLRETGRLSETGKTDTLRALHRFRHLVQARGLETVLIAATAAMRDAEDAGEFRDQVLHETGFDIAPIAGTEEARLAASGVLAGDRRARGLACDLGGASLEVIELTPELDGRGVSLPLGPFPVVGDDLRLDFDPDAQRPVVEAALADVPLEVGGEPLHLVGGAWRNLLAVHLQMTDYPLHVLQGYGLPSETALEFCRWAYGEGREAVLDWPGISERRRETLPYGALALECAIRRFAPAEIRVSSTGLREGLVADYLRELRRKRSPLVDGCRDLARGNLQAEGFAIPLERFLAPIDAHLPAAFAADNEARLRQAARHLAGMGRGLHPDYRAELVFENVITAPLSGLEHAERAYLAHIMHNCYTQRMETANEPAMERLLTPQQRRCAQGYGMAIRLAVAASGRTPELLDRLHLSWDGEVDMRADVGFDSLVGARASHRLIKLNKVLADLPDAPDSEDEGD